MENGKSETICPGNDAESDGTGMSVGDTLFKNIMAARADILDMECDEEGGGVDETSEKEVQLSRTISPAGAIVADEPLPSAPTTVESAASIFLPIQETIDTPTVQNEGRVEEEANTEQISPPSKRQRTSSPSVDPEPVLYDPYSPPPGSKSIDEVLDEARSHLRRLSPTETYKLLTTPPTPTSPPAILVDIRPVAQRREEGSIEGAVIIERNVLEWRFDPRSDSRLPMADRYDLKVVVFCSEGYTSSLAARSLQELGLENATDMVGGYKAWRKARLGSVSTGLPTKG